jgi:hypothetical protein
MNGKKAKMKNGKKKNGKLNRQPNFIVLFFKFKFLCIEVLRLFFERSMKNDVAIILCVFYLSAFSLPASRYGSLYDKNRRLI